MATAVLLWRGRDAHGFFFLYNPWTNEKENIYRYKSFFSMHSLPIGTYNLRIILSQGEIFGWFLWSEQGAALWSKQNLAGSCDTSEAREAPPFSNLSLPFLSAPHLVRLGSHIPLVCFGSHSLHWLFAFIFFNLDTSKCLWKASLTKFAVDF
jgi:hypothetical protein